MTAAWSFAAGPEIVSLEKIWDQGSHNAFTDLIRFQNQWFCTFREADDHVGGDGKIRVLVSRDGSAWQSAALLEEKDIDLRDPKLSVTPDGRLMVVAGGSVYLGTKDLKGRQPRVAFSKDGRTWTKPRKILGNGDWLWRVTWHGGRAYGVSYNTRPQPGAVMADEWNVTLFESKDGVDWRQVTVLNVPGRPNETTLRFTRDGEMLALVRREADDKIAWLGSSLAPYREWAWQPAGYQFGGPNFILLDDGSMVAGGRLYGKERGSNRTAMGTLTRKGYTPLLTLPSSGDSSYPGFVWHDGLLWMSYYSTHEGKTSIYLAKIRLR
ncbi:MAG: exo-alpha-sialidase [Bryobacterales bacterium]|nr:exo-alpha-sialidase [Bryobacterales bacterium]